jgi:NAD(P)-dependent dehydrogenase (short-subunit alcohol dehydrogenase family)
MRRWWPRMPGSSSVSPDRTVLVTGATSGIGLAITKHFAANGLRVIGTSRDPNAIPEESRVDGVTYLALDQLDYASVQTCAKEAGEVDILINNAGQSQGGAVEEVSEERLEWLFRLNVFGPVALTRALIAGMRERRWGRILFIGSLMAEFPVPFESGYSASKMALRGFVGALRTELEPFGIKTALVQPGYYRSAIDRHREWHVAPDSPYAERVSRVISKVQASHKHAGDPADVAALVWRLTWANIPPVVSTIGSSGPALRFAKRLVPDRITEGIVERRFDLRRK